jgi:hypothetical protein
MAADKTPHHIESVSAFGALSDDYRALIKKTKVLPEEVTAPSPKISRGEQYRQLPYVMLDYPRFFTRDHSFAVRTMFWWGNYFSIHLVLSGKYKNQFATTILRSLKAGHWHIGVNADHWQHHFEAGNYQPIDGNEKVSDREYFKLGASHALSDWTSARFFLSARFRDLIDAAHRSLTIPESPHNDAR